MDNKWVDRITFWVCSSMVAVYIVTVICIVFIADAKERNSVKYDCRLAEISVDYPSAVKQKCRELIGEHKDRR